MSWSEGSEMAYHMAGSWVDMAAGLGSAGTADQRTKSPVNKVEATWFLMT